MALALNNIDHTHTLMGRPRDAIAYLERALELRRTAGHSGVEAQTRQSIGEAYLSLGDPAPAMEHLTAALRPRRDPGERGLEAEMLLLGDAHREGRDSRAATAPYTAAVAAVNVARSLGDVRLQERALTDLRT